MSGPLLQVDALDLYYGDAQALSGVSIEIAAGEVVAIVGANGAGKSSLIRAIHGSEKPGAGHVRFDGTDITGWSSHRVCETGVGHVAEGRQVFPNLSVLENLEMGAILKRARAAASATLDRVFDLVPRLAERRKQAAGTLSGGEQQMLAIGRALMGNPSVLLLDEPSEGLAPLIVAEVGQTIKRLKSEGQSIILVEQNRRLALDVADQAVILNTGRCAFVGTADQVRTDEDLVAQHLGVYHAH